MSVNFLISQAKNIQKVIDENASEIESLDQNIGDGDHIFNILRGLDEILNLKQELLDKPVDHIFKQLGSTPDNSKNGVDNYHVGINKFNP